MPPRSSTTRSSGSSRPRCAPCWWSAWSWRPRRSCPARRLPPSGPRGRCVPASRGSRGRGERHGVSTGPAGEWTYARRQALRIAAVGLFALIFVFWGHPTAAVVILLVVLLLVVLALIELIGRPPAAPGPAESAGQT